MMMYLCSGTWNRFGKVCGFKMYIVDHTIHVGLLKAMLVVNIVIEPQWSHPWKGIYCSPTSVAYSSPHQSSQFL